MKISKPEYAKMVEKATPPSKKLRDFTLAFLIGGFICLIGQLLRELYFYLGLPEASVQAAVPVSLIFIAALLTGLDLFEKIARKRGFLRSGGVIDEDRAAGVILDEFRAAKIGRITLDRE